MKKQATKKRKLDEKQATLKALWAPPPPPPPESTEPDIPVIEEKISFGTKQTGLMGFFGAKKEPEFISDTRMEASRKRIKDSQNDSKRRKQNDKTDVHAHNQLATEENFLQVLTEDEMIDRTAKLHILETKYKNAKLTYFDQHRQSSMSTLFGTGKVNANLMIIRSMPSREDNEAWSVCHSIREPLVNIAKEKNIDLTKYAYFTNLLKVRIPRGKPATCEDIEESLEYLKEQIKIIRPKVIIAIGAEVSTVLLQHFSLRDQNKDRKNFDGLTVFRSENLWKIRKDYRHITVSCMAEENWLGRLHVIQDPVTFKPQWRAKSEADFKEDIMHALEAVYWKPLKIQDPTEEFEKSLMNKGFDTMESYARHLGVKLSEPTDQFFDRGRFYDIPLPECYLTKLQTEDKPLKFLLQNARFDEYSNQYYLFGRTEEGYLMCTQLRNPTYRMYIKHKSFNAQPNETRDVDHRLQNLTDLMTHTINLLHADMVMSGKYKGISRADFVDRIKLEFQWVRKRPFRKYHKFTKNMLQISFRENDVKDRVVRIVESYLKLIETFQAKLTALERFYYDTGAFSNGWVTIPHGSLEKVEINDSIADFEFAAPWDMLTGYEPFQGEYSALAKFIVADFDGEMKGQRGYFPISQQDPIIRMGVCIQEYCDPNRPMKTQVLRDPKDSSQVYPTGRSNYTEKAMFVLGVHEPLTPRIFQQNVLPTIPHFPIMAPAHHKDINTEIGQRLLVEWNEFISNMYLWIKRIGTTRAEATMTSKKLRAFFLQRNNCNSSTLEDRKSAELYYEWKQKYLENLVLGPMSKEDTVDPLVYGHWKERIRVLREVWKQNLPDEDVDNLQLAMPDYNETTIGCIQYEWDIFNPTPKTFFFKTEEKLLIGFCEYIRQAGVDLVRGHNIGAFDIPYLQQRINVLNIRQNKYFAERSNHPISMGRANFNRPYPIPSLRSDTVSQKITVTKAANEVKHMIPDIPGVDYLDTLPWARKEIQPNLKHHTLSYIAKRLVKDQKFDVPGSSISSLYTNDPKRLSDYCDQDVELTVRCSNVQNATPFTILCSRIIGAIQICELYTTGVQRMIHNILMRYLKKEGLNKVVSDTNPFSVTKEMEEEWNEGDEIEVDGSTVKKRKKNEKGYKGATCIAPLVGLLIAIWLCWDFAALYPTIMIAKGLSHDLMGTLSHFKKLEVPLDRLWTSGEKFYNPKTKQDEEWYFMQKRELTEAQAAALPGFDDQEPGLAQCVKNPDGKYTPKLEVGALIGILVFILAQRAMVNGRKKTFKSNTLEYAVLDCHQLVLKKIANSTYGFTGCTTGKYAAKQIGAGVTFVGRETLELVCKLMDAVRPGKLGGGDTDSIFRLDDWIKDPNQIYEEVELPEKLEDPSTPLVKRAWVEHIQIYLNRHVPRPMRIIFEKAFWPMFMVAKKRGLVGVLMPFENKFTGKMCFENIKPKFSVKGVETTRRDQLPITQRIMKNFLKHFLITKEEERAPAIKAATEYVAEEVRKLHVGEYDIFELVETRYYGKSNPKAHTAMMELCNRKRKRGDPIPDLGNRQAFIVVQGDKKEGVNKRVEDPIYVIEHGLEPDIDYVTKKICKPIMRFAKHLGDPIKLQKFMFPTFIANKKKSKIQSNNPLLKQMYIQNMCEMCPTNYPENTYNISGRERMCAKCKEELPAEVINSRLLTRRRKLEVDFEKAADSCYSCLSIDKGDEIDCHNFTCKKYFPRMQSTIKLKQFEKLSTDILTQIMI